MGGTQQTALITGASGGIGYELAKVFAAHGHALILVARSEAKLRELAKSLETDHGVAVTVMAKDLTQPKASEELYHAVEAAGHQVDILVNNAGFGLFGPMVEADVTDTVNIVQLNVGVLTELTRRFAAPMTRRGRGAILNVASTAAFQPGPLMAVYYASKAYVLSLSEALHNELKDNGITVTALCPGPTETGFQRRAKMGGSKLFNSRLLQVMDARTVAEAGFRGLMRGKPLVIPGWMNRMSSVSSRFLPRRAVPGIVRKFQENR